MGGWQSPKDAMPWVGLYASGASLLCTLAMAADAFLAFRQWRLWFPCRMFTINAASITLIAIAMKLPVDLTTDMFGSCDWEAKQVSVFFLVTMLANFLPSLGHMGDKELLTNIIALGILLITIIVNVLIQSLTFFSYNLYSTIIILIFPILLVFSVALIAPTSRGILEKRYKELHELDSVCQEINFSYKELTRNVKKSWMMTETGNPQFVIACSSVSYVFGAICSIIVVSLVFYLEVLFEEVRYNHPETDYKWSTIVILVVQTFGAALGCVAPIFRCFTAISHFDISKRWSLNHLNVFKVEKYWTLKLQHWKSIHVRSHIPGRHLKLIFHSLKNTILNCCIALQIMLVFICKTISLVPRCFLILLTCCWRYFCLPLLKRCKKEQSASNNNVRSEIEEYAHYALCFEEESRLSKWLLRNTLNSITKVIHKSEKKEPGNLVKLLKKSTGFDGVREFDNHQDPQENQNSWSLVVVTLTAITIALPNIEDTDVKELLASMREGLHFVGHIEENLNANTDGLVKARKTSKHLWTEVEVYNMWLKIELQKKARNGKTSREILLWLSEKAVEVVEKFKGSKNDSLDHSDHKFIAANSMYRISQTILHYHDENENWPQDKDLFEWISTLNADILCACFTNLPCVIKMKCHHDAIEKREYGILSAAQLLGKSKKILKILKPRQLPNIDPDSMAYIDKWRALPKCQIPSDGASPVEIHQGSSSSKDSLSVTIMK